jgi:hypothetical protein
MDRKPRRRLLSSHVPPPFVDIVTTKLCLILFLSLLPSATDSFRLAPSLPRSLARSLLLFLPVFYFYFQKSLLAPSLLLTLSHAAIYSYLLSRLSYPMHHNSPASLFLEKSPSSSRTRNTRIYNVGVYRCTAF